MFTSAVDTPNVLHVLTFWNSPRSTITLMTPNRTSSNEYITTLSVNLYSVPEDSGFYTVTFNISSGPFINGVSGSKARNITVKCEF